MTIEDLQNLLDKQKQITIDRLLSHNYIYNKDSTEGHLKPLNIDEEKFKEHGLKSEYPNDFLVLKKYIKE